MREMKDSGVDWIGMIPSHWGTLENKFYCERIYSGGTPDSNNPNYWDGDIPWIPSGSCQDCLITSAPKSITQDGLNNSSTRYIPAGTTVMAMTGATCSKVGYVTFDTCMNQSVIAFVENKKICSSKYLYYLYQAAREYILTFQTGGAQSGINGQNCRNLVMPFLPLSEQQRIADFLDRKCAEIDKVLVKTNTSIEEYKKLKQSVITKAVTKGIRGERPMKDSGSAWFGKIPASWDANKLKYTFTIRKRIVGEDGNTVLAITQKGVKPKDMSNGNGQFAESYANYQIVHPGDFAMNHMDLLTGWVDISKYEGVTSPDYRVFTLDDTTRNCPGYYLYMMQMCYSNRIFYSMGQGVSGMGRWRLPADMFNNFIIACPPFEEQQEIAEYLDKKCSEIDSLIASKEKFITELESYKKSLIYEYVTGKKEVPSNA